MTVPQQALKLWGEHIYLRRVARDCLELASACLQGAEDAIPQEELVAHLASVEVAVEVLRSHYGELAVDRGRAKVLARLERQLGEAKNKTRRCVPPPLPPDLVLPTGDADDLLTVKAVSALTGRSEAALFRAIGRRVIRVEYEGHGVRIRRSEALRYDATARKVRA